MFCRRCGTKLGENVLFCPNCGCKVENAVFKDEPSSVYSNGETDLKKTSASYDYGQQNYEPDSEEFLHGVTEYNPGNDYSAEYNDNFDQSDKTDKTGNASKSSIGKRIISILLSVLLCIFSLSAMLIGVVRISFDEENVTEILNDIDLTEIKINVDGTSENIADYVVTIISDDVIDEYNITADTVESILEDDDIKVFLINGVNDYISFFVKGEDFSELDSEKIINFLKDNESKIYDESGYRLTENDYKYLEDEINGGSLKFLTTDGFKDTLNFNADIVSMFFSIPFLIIFISLAVLVAVFIFFLNECKIKYLFSYVGMSEIISGSILLLVAAGIFIVSILEIFAAINLLIQPLALNCLTFGGGALLIGLIMFILYRTIFRKK